MSVAPDRDVAAAMVQPFPKPPPLVRLAYKEINAAAGSTEGMARPWIPSTCTRPPLRAQLWKWLEEVVVWLNHEHCFDTADMLPRCWPRHPHLVHELAVLADRRLSAEISTSSDHLEEWHRFTLPAFRERARRQLAQHCDNGHPSPSPMLPRLSRHLDDNEVRVRAAAYAADVASVTPSETTGDETPRRTLRSVDGDTVVDIETGEVQD